jgi:hypothetical protein
MRQIITLLFLGFVSLLSAQTPSFTHEFNDTSTQELTRIEGKIILNDKDMILYGFIKKGNYQTPVIMKTNNTGDILWSTYPSIINGSLLINPKLEVCASKDGYVYATMLTTSGNPRYIWRIQISTGKIIYHKPFNQGLASSPTMSNGVTFIDYDPTTLIGLYNYQVNGSYQQRCLAKINKITGDTTQTMLVGTSYNSHGILTDDQNNLIVWNDSILTKFNRFNTNDVLWRKNLKTVTPNFSDKIDHAYLNAEGQLIVLGKKTSSTKYFTVFKINAQTGDIIWSTKLQSTMSYTDVNFNRMQEDDDYLYYLFTHEFVGSSMSNVYLAKLNKNTGSLLWLTNHAPTQVNGISSAYKKAALDFGFTCSNFISVTGYYGSSNYGPGTWFVMNLDKTTGAKLNDFTEMVNNYAAGDYYSVGKVNWSTPSRSLAYGTLNESGFNTWAHRVEFNPANGQIIKDDRVNAEFSNQSYVVQLDRFGDTNYVLKQHGNDLVIEARNNQDSIIWKTNYIDTGSVVVGLFDVSESYVGAVVSYKGNPLLPMNGGSTVTHTRYLIFSRSTGAMINTIIQTVGSTDFYYRELEVNETNMLVCYRQAGGQFMKRWTYGTTTTQATVVLPSEYLKEGSLTNTLVSYDANYYIGVISGTIYKIPKNGGTNILLKILPNIKSINDIYLKNNVLYLVGQHNNLSERIVRYDIASNTFTYDLNFSQGSIRRIVENSNQHLVLAAQRNSKIHVLCIKPTTGNILWQYYADSLQYPNLQLRDMAVNDHKQVLCLTGAIVYDSTHSDALINFISYYGDQLSSLKLTDSIVRKSFGAAIMRSSSNRTLVGGAWNKLDFDQSGFLNAYNLQFCTRQITQDQANCQGNPVALHAWSGTSYQWYKNGIPILGATTQNYTPTISGLYNVMVTDTCSQDTLMVPYNYVMITGVNNVVLTGNTSLCTGQTQVLTANTGVNYQWYLNGAAIQGATQITYAATLPGHYNVGVTNMIGCTDTSAIGLTISLLPQPSIQVPVHPSQICANSASMLLNFLPAGGTLTGQGISNGTFNPTSAGSGWNYFQYTLAATGYCSATAYDSIFVYALTTQDPFITQDAANCQGTPVALHVQASNPLGYQWYQNGLPILGAISNSFVPTVSGQYNVMVSFACIQDSSNNSYNYTLIAPQPPVSISQSTQTYCPGDTILLQTQASANIQWYLNGQAISGANQSSYEATQGGMYNVQLTNTSGCSDSADIQAQITELPILTSSNNLPYSFCDNDAVFNVEFLPAGGVLTSSSLNGLSFNPANASAGWHYVQYQLNMPGSCPLVVFDSLLLLQSSQFTIDTTVTDTLDLNGQIYTQSGQYQQQFTSSNGCDSLLNILLTVDHVGIEELTQLDFQLWPNPNGGQFQLEVPEQNNYVFACYDALGRLIYTCNLERSKSYVINLPDNLASGSYRILMSTVDAQKNLPLIIQK